MKPAYFNEIDPYAAAWLRNLIAAGHIPAGDVDERSIVDVSADDVRGYGQQHYFAGVGVWAYALRLAGFPEDREVWTGSCPCQPFSVAGRRNGFDDERHLWPAWFRLIEQCKPQCVFGEQVASAAALPWVDAVFDDLEGAGYACAAVDFPACGVGAPHIRQRLFWVADGGLGHADRAEREARDAEPIGDAARSKRAAQSGALVGLADTARQQFDGRGDAGAGWRIEPAIGGGPVNGFWQAVDWLHCRDGKHRPVRPGTRPLVAGAPARVGRLRAYGNSINAEAAKEFVVAYMECQP